MAGISSKEAQASLIDPLNAPEPSAETGLNSHFGSTMAPRANGSPRSSLSSNNPFRDGAGSPTTSKHAPPSKSGVTASERPVHGGGEAFPGYREEAFGGYTAPRRSASGATRQAPPPSYEAVSRSPGGSPAAGGSGGVGRSRRSSSLRERYPGDDSHKPLDIIRKDSRKANRSPHLNKRHIPGADVIDRLDPALGGHAYHHEGPYDAATLARNTNYKNSPIAALETSNLEALKATPAENIKDAVERHKPLDGVAVVPPGEKDRFGRTYDYQEGADLMREGDETNPGYKRWPGKDYDPEDLKGQGDTFALDRALRAHKINDDGIEMSDRAGIDRAYHKAERDGSLDKRDPVDIAGGDRKYVDLEFANASSRDAEIAGGMDSLDGTSGLKKGIGSIKKRIGSLRHRKNDN